MAKFLLCNQPLKGCYSLSESDGSERENFCTFFVGRPEKGGLFNEAGRPCQKLEKKVVCSW